MDFENDISSSASSMESATVPSSRSKCFTFNRCYVLKPGRAKKSHAWGRVTAVVSFPFLPTCVLPYYRTLAYVNHPKALAGNEGYHYQDFIF
jgi:hypothetical protein